MSGIRVGLLVDTPLKRQYLTLSTQEAGHRVEVTELLPECSGEALEWEAMDAWVVDVTLSADGEPPAAVQVLLEKATVPLIVSDSSDYEAGSEAHTAWLKRTLAKLRQLAGDINLQNISRAQQLWVLAASTGGPAAVKAFLSGLPPDLGLAFLYVQHIDTGYTGTLVKMMSQSAYPAMLAREGDVLQANRMSIVTARERVDILDNGTLVMAGEPWAGPYAPSIDQLVANAARVYGENLGLIVFTGMGDDGASASRLVRRRGGQVWAQTPADCASSSMPDAVLTAGTATLTGTPEQLANQLAVRGRAPVMNQIEEALRYESSAH